MGIKNNKYPCENYLQAERFRYCGTEITKMTEIVTKKGHQDRWK